MASSGSEPRSSSVGGSCGFRRIRMRLIVATRPDVAESDVLLEGCGRRYPSNITRAMVVPMLVTAVPVQNT
jgi:hypothetical protein